MQEIALVFIGVLTFVEFESFPIPLDASVMSSRKPMASEAVYVFSQDTKLNLSITQNIRIRRAPAFVLIQEMSEH